MDDHTNTHQRRYHKGSRNKTKFVDPKGPTVVYVLFMAAIDEHFYIGDPRDLNFTNGWGGGPRIDLQTAIIWAKVWFRLSMKNTLLFKNIIK